jgi:pimeloyl-ACP methyl ester carboxylesterase
MKKLETKTLELPDIKIAYCEYGKGPNLILLHGNSESKSIFKQYQTVFFKDFHTYAIDSRGHGQSVSDDQEYSIEQYSQDIMRFCSELGIEKPYTIGYSDGGNISLFLALNAPNVFERIIAISPNYLVSGTTDSALKLLRGIFSGFVFLRRMGVNTQKWIMRFKLMLTDIGLSKEDLGKIKAAIRILYAENDLIKEDHIIEMNSSIPNSTIKKINGCTHLTILNQEETVKEIKQYFEGNCSGFASAD